MDNFMYEEEGIEVRPMGAYGETILKIVLIPVIAALNYVTGAIVTLTRLPAFLDTWATSFGVIVAGLWVGALGGFLYNIIMALTLWGLPAWVWGFINVYIAVITWIFYRAGWVDIKKPVKLIAAGLITGFTNTFACTLVSVVAFGALPTAPSPFMTAVYAWALNATGNMVFASWMSSVAVELYDKTIALYIAAIVASALPKRFILTKSTS